MTRNDAEKNRHKATEILMGYADENIRIAHGVERNQYVLSMEYGDAECFKRLCDSRVALENHLIKEGYTIVVSSTVHDPANIGVRGTFNIAFVERNVK